MKTTKDLRLSDISSMYKDINGKKDIGSLIKLLMGGVTVDNTNAKETFAMYNIASKSKFKKDILGMLHDEKIILKYNPDATLGNYFLYVPAISNSGSVKIYVNVNYFTDYKDSKFKFKGNEFDALLNGAYVMYKVINNYGKISANHGMRKALIELYMKVVVQSLRGSSMFASSKNMGRLTYIMSRFMYQHHFGLTPEKAIEFATSFSKIDDIEERAWITNINLKYEDDYNWEALDNITGILQNEFIALKDKVSISSLRNNAGILLGAPSVLALDYVPYLAVMAIGQSDGHVLFRSSNIKREMGPECINVINDVIYRL